LKLTQRRARQPDPLALRAAVQAVIKELRAELPGIIPAAEKQVLSLLRAALHAERHPEVNTRRGRKSRWKDYELVKTAACLRRILERGTKRISLRSFIEHYLLIPGFPEDVVQALEAGQINLFEAEQLARLLPARTGRSAAQMKQQRQALLRLHLQSGGSGARLKARVAALLHRHQQPEAALQSASEESQYAPEILSAARQLEAEFEAAYIDAEGWIADLAPDHLFYEYLQIITAMMREIRPDEISDAALERLMSLAEQLIRQLNTIYKQQNPPVDEATSGEAKKSFHI
jgi:hypothetical protein